MREESSVAQGFGMAAGCLLFLVVLAVGMFVSCTGCLASKAAVARPKVETFVDRAVAKAEARTKQRETLRNAVRWSGWHKGDEILELAALDGLTTGATRGTVAVLYGKPDKAGATNDDPQLAAIFPGMEYDGYSEGPVTFIFAGGRLVAAMVGLSPFALADK